MSSQVIIDIEKKQMKETIPAVNVGDTVKVESTIVEGEKKRVMKFEGTVIKIQGKYSRHSITVRRIIASIGVEKTFLLHSPLVEVNVLKRGKVRRSRLFYLRDRVGAKAIRVKSRD